MDSAAGKEMSRLAPIQEVCTPSPRLPPRRLESLCRALLLRLFALSFQRHFSAYLQRWHFATTVLRHLGGGRAKTGLVCRVGTGVKTKIQPPKVEIKSVRALKPDPSASPCLSAKRIPLNASFKLPRTKTDDPEAKKKEESKSDRLKMDPHRRPISVPPEREDFSAALRVHGREEQSSTPVQPSDEAKSALSKPARGKSSQRGNDVGTRLFNQAQEIESKRAEMRKSMEPDYSFTPRLAQSTQKWLSQKSAKSTPMKTRVGSEEVAVVSSSTLLGPIGEMISPRETETMAKTRPSAVTRKPYISQMSLETASADLLMATEKWERRSNVPRPLNRTLNLSSEYVSFGIHSKDLQLTEPEQCSPSFVEEDSSVYIDVMGEESCESLLEYAEK